MSSRKELFKEGMNTSTTGQKLANFISDTFSNSDKEKKDKERREKERQQARTELPTERY